MSTFDPAVGAQLGELAPLVRRAVSLDPRGLARIRLRDHAATLLVRLPFGVLAARTISLEFRLAEAAVEAKGARPSPDPTWGQLDATVGGAELLAWLDGERDRPPALRDSEWIGGVPPTAGWRRLDTVPDDVVRGLVRSGALALKQAAAREGVPDAQPRAEVADALLDAVVLTVEDERGAAPIQLRTLSALTRMGFLSRGSHAAVDVAGRWIRVAGEYGSVYAERPGAGLGLLSR